MWMLVVLVIVTIGFEKGSEALEEAVGEHCIERELLDKMFKELTILGFVAFSATMLIQAEMLPLTHGQHLCFEFAHVLMFSTAIVYAKEIFLVAGSLQGIRVKFEDYDNTPPEDVLDRQVKRYGNRTDEVPAILYQPVPFKLSMSRHFEHLQSIFSKHEQVVVFKALKFHFLGFNGLLGTRFSVSDYIERCSEKHVGHMIEIGMEAWGTLLAILGIGLAASWFESQATDEAPLVHVGTALFILWGFLLMVGEVGLLIMAKDNLAQMTEKNHHIRTEMDGDRWEEYDEHHAILESELRALMLSVSDKKEATRINEEMQKAYAMYETEVLKMDEGNKARLDKLEAAFQTFMLLQSMLQSSRLKVPPPPWQRPSSAPVPPQGAPGGSGQLGPPRKEPGPLGAQPPPRRVLEQAASKAAHFTPRLLSMQAEPDPDDAHAQLRGALRLHAGRHRRRSHVAADGAHDAPCHAARTRAALARLRHRRAQQERPR